MDLDSQDPDAPTCVEGGDAGVSTTLDQGSMDDGGKARTIGRYLVLEEIGVGGMGRVYLAYDTKLRREVALKVLLPHANSSVAARGRMLREAQAMAQLSHPNVVPVYDVDTDVDGALYIAMEYVAGQTMVEWLEPTPTLSEVLWAFREAGKGLIAAHEAGLVHRDFKPANVMMGADGRVRVMDFGLARGDAEAEASAAADDSSGSHASRGSHASHPGSSASLSASYTMVGTVVGTPIYMAPEQYRSTAEVDPRTDQYAFCVALVIALSGDSPFPGVDFQGVYERKRDGGVVLPSAALPAWLVPLLRRGLAPAMEDRWPTLQALLDQFARDPGVTRRRWLSAGALSVALGAAVVAVAFGAESPPSSQVCAGSEAQLEGVWDPSRRRAAEDAILATELVYAPKVWASVAAGLDAYVEGWVAARVETCEATQVHREQSEVMLDQRMHCLDRRLDEIDALIELMTTADAVLVGHAVAAVDQLEPVASCDASAFLGRADLPSDPEARVSLAAASHAMAHANALVAAGRARAGADAAAEAEAYAKDLGFPWIEAEAGIVGARALVGLGEFADARESLLRAELVADAAGEDRLRVQALSNSMRHAMHQEGDAEAAALHRRAAQAVLERLGNPPLEHFAYLDALGVVLAEQARYDEALTAFERALELGSHHDFLALGGVRSDYGAALFASGRHREALEIHQQCLVEFEASLGPDHPELGDALLNVAASLQALGEPEQALSVSDRIVALHLSAKGPRSPDVADAYNNRAVVYGLLERHDDAAVDYERALEIWIEIAPKNPRRGVVMFNLAETHLHRGRPEEALSMLEGATAVFSESLPPGHPYNAFVAVYRGWGLLELGRHAEAVESLEPALAVLTESGIDARSEAQARLLLGEALALGGDTQRADELVRAAQAQLDERGASYWSKRAQRWLDERSLPQR